MVFCLLVGKEFFIYKYKLFRDEHLSAAHTMHATHKQAQQLNATSIIWQSTPTSPHVLVERCSLRHTWLDGAIANTGFGWGENVKTVFEVYRQSQPRHHSFWQSQLGESGQNILL